MRGVVEWLREHRHRTSIAFALVCGVSGVAAFMLDPFWARRGCAIVAFVTALAYGIAWLPGWGFPKKGTPLGKGLPRLALVVVTSAVVLLGFVVAVATFLGWLLEHKEEAMPTSWLWAGVIVLMVGAWLTLGWWLRLAVATFAAPKANGEPRTSWAPHLLTGLFAVGLVVLLLSGREPPNAVHDPEVAQARSAGAGRFDVLLVVDPSDAVSRALVTAAKRALRTGDDLFPQRPDASPYDVAFGIAEPMPRRRGRALWRLVEPPTTDSEELTRSLAAMERRGSTDATGSYARIVADALDGLPDQPGAAPPPSRVRWRQDAQRSIVFALARLPSHRQLDGSLGIRTRPTTRGETCERLAGRVRPITRNRTVPVPWHDALAAHCLHLSRYEVWLQDGRPANRPMNPPVYLDVLTSERRRQRAEAWRDWSQILDGRFHRPRFRRDTPVHVRAQQRLRLARLIQAGAPIGGLRKVAEWYRPHLLFDSDERFRPVDVDWLLANPPRGKAHRVCDHHRFGDDCAAIRDGSLVSDLDELIDFAGDEGHRGRGLAASPTSQLPASMYVHVWESGPRWPHKPLLYLDYWWYLPYNVTPWKADVNCLPGFTFRDATCFDHEGDWEGVTVALEIVDSNPLEPLTFRNLRPKAVLYAAHAHIVRWDWADVELAADEGSYATHPVVYVAADSHASYPAACSGNCDQRLAASAVGEGDHDGKAPWAYNPVDACANARRTPDRGDRGSCLQPLPSTRDGRFGTLWNAFPGKWGSARCVALAKVCAQVDGPQSPGLQRRFRKPGTALTIGSRKRLARARGHRPRTTRAAPGAAPDPPPAWPPRGRPLRSTPRLPAGVG